MSNVVRDARDECVRAIERALEAMDPPIEIYAAILQLIAEFTVDPDKWRHYYSRVFKVEGKRLTYTGVYWCSAYGAATISSDRRSWRIRIEKTKCGNIFIGVARNHDHTVGSFYRGDSGYAYDTYDGTICDGNKNAICRSGVKARTGDVVTVELDADAWMLTFRKNDSEAIGTVEDIKRGDYRIAVALCYEDDAVSFAT